MKILVCGGRNYRNKKRLREVLASWNPTTVIEGGAGGADRLAGEWAREHEPRVSLLTVPADWAHWGKAAGPRRNRQMLEHRPDMVLAFPGGDGTADMVRQAKAAGVPVVEVAA